MSDDAARDEVTYCPRCFHIVEGGLVFCRHCGQFIHANAPADSRPWDTQPPRFPPAQPIAESPVHRIVLPEDQFPSRPPLEANTDKAAGDGATETIAGAGDGTERSTDDGEGESPKQTSDTEPT